MYSFGMVGYITIILLIMGAVFLLATRVVGKTVKLIVYIGIVIFVLYILKSEGIL